MNTIERLKAVIASAEQQGYLVRLEQLDGQGGGACEIHGRKQLFIDLTLSPRDQLEQIESSLAEDLPSARCENSADAYISAKAA